jgi:hypothetical protein
MTTLLAVITLDECERFTSIAIRDVRLTEGYLIELALPMVGPDESLVSLCVEVEASP